MIYLTAIEGKTLLIIESGNIDKLKMGKPLSTPDEKIMVTYTPDLQWVYEQIEERKILEEDKVDAAELDKILKESLAREEVK